ncbi:MAG: translation initiation factor IF-3 [Chloroflexota bacterium]
MRDIIKDLPINERIRAREVRLVGEKGEQFGIMPLSQAREVARKQGFDLVQVAASAVPPVCRLLDYGKYKYEQSKKERELKRGQRASMLREVRMRPKIGIHDFEAKARSARKLLEGGDKVKVTVMFRGREITHPDIGWKLLKKMAEALKDIAALDRQPIMEGRRMNIIMSVTSSQRAKIKEGEKQS